MSERCTQAEPRGTARAKQTATTCWRSRVSDPRTAPPAGYPDPPRRLDALVRHHASGAWRPGPDVRRRWTFQGIAGGYRAHSREFGAERSPACSVRALAGAGSTRQLWLLDQQSPTRDGAHPGAVAGVA